MSDKLIITLVLAMCSAFSQIDASSEELAMDTTEPLDVKLNVQATPKAIAVNVLVRNRSDRPILIEKIDADIGEPLPHEFLITSHGQKVEYVGPMIKRSPYTRDDFRWLKPGEKIQRDLRIEGLFDFLSGRHEYQLTYLYLRYNEELGTVAVHKSASVAFVYESAAARTSP